MLGTTTLRIQHKLASNKGHLHNRRLQISVRTDRYNTNNARFELISYHLVHWIIGCIFCYNYKDEPLLDTYDIRLSPIGRQFVKSLNYNVKVTIRITDCMIPIRWIMLTIGLNIGYIIWPKSVAHSHSSSARKRVLVWLSSVNRLYYYHLAMFRTDARSGAGTNFPVHGLQYSSRCT